MNILKKLAFSAVGAAGMFSLNANAKIKLPSFAGNADAESQVENVAGKIYSFGLYLVGLVLVLGLLRIGYLFLSGQGDKGREEVRSWLVGGIICAAATGIAGLFAN